MSVTLVPGTKKVSSNLRGSSIVNKISGGVLTTRVTLKDKKEAEQSLELTKKHKSTVTLEPRKDKLNLKSIAKVEAPARKSTVNLKDNSKMLKPKV